MTKVSLTSSTIKVLALDFEGTLIANSSNLIPRPGLYEFLEWCKSKFESIAIYTCVEENKFRSIAGNLVQNKSVPPWFKDIGYIEWDGMIKDLYNIDGITPKQAILVDDAEIFILEAQKPQWIKIKTFDLPYPVDDNELLKVANIIEKNYLKL
jgi:NLI interacting factor-like phosphatase